jgi:hypothetical protein
MQDFLDYIDLIRPGLKGQICNLSAILPQIVENRFPPQKLVLETLTSNLLPQLRNRSLEELFQFDAEVVASRQADAAVGPSSDHGHANGQLSYAQGTIESLQNIRPDYTSESPQSRSPSAGIEDGNPQLSYTQRTIETVQNIRSDYTSESLQSRSSSTDIEDGNPSSFTTDYSEFAHLSEKSDSRELNQQFNRNMEDPSSFQNVDRSAQPQPSHSGGVLDPQDHYDQDDDWRAQQPSGDCEGDFPDFEDGDLQRSGPSEAEFSDFDSLINYSPPNTPSIPSISLSQSRGRNLSAHLVDMQRASTPLQSPSASSHYFALPPESHTKFHSQVDTWQNGSMSDSRRTWSAYGQDTVNPKDLVRISSASMHLL